MNMPMGPEGNWIEVSPPGAESRLVLYPKKMMQNWQEMKASIVFFTTDIKKTYEQMKERGVTFTEELKSMPWGSYCRFVPGSGRQRFSHQGRVANQEISRAPSFPVRPSLSQSSGPDPPAPVFERH